VIEEAKKRVLGKDPSSRNNKNKKKTLLVKLIAKCLDEYESLL